ncbi:MAG TPA: carboxypeptidase regulatory-like domain-containing protein [Acidobacteriaceae bacterium]|nr:carboxypeptidase regulatory-like domain-containing protein [Acidobacteriaceae bacterium]
MRGVRNNGLGILLAGLLAVLAGSAWGQQTVPVCGQVTDTTGAVLPGAAVTINPAAGGAKGLQTVADGEGTFRFAALEPGEYVVRASAAGFAPAEQRVTVAAQAVTLHLALAVAQMNQTVTVNATSAALATTDTSTGGTLDAQAVQALPLNGRSFTDAIAVQPGVAPASASPPNSIVMSGVASTPPSGELDSGALSISGQRETANSFRVNGADAQEDVNMGVAIVPTLDAIAELNVLTGNDAPEYGTASGGQVAVVTKSGTNQWHGSAFEYLRNTNLDARNYFSQERAGFHQNQFGATLGGPVVKDKLFFFSDYQGTQVAEGIDTGLIAVPTVGERSGDFSGETSALTGRVSGPYLAQRLTRELGHAVTQGEPYYTTGCTTASQCVLPNARVPQTAWAQAAGHLIGYVPQANAGAGTFSTSAAEQTIRDDKGALRMDWNTRMGSVAGYYFLDDYTVDNPYPTGTGGATVPGFDAVNFGRAQLLALSDTKTFGANTVNLARVSTMRNAANVGRPQGGVGPSLASQGFSGIVPLKPQTEGVENVIFNGFTMGVDVTALFQAENIVEGSDDFSHVIGRHNLKFGADVHGDQINNHPDVYFNGSFAFTGSETGLDFADFLLGVDSNYTQGDARDFYNRNLLAGAYAQDSWQVRKGLTLNYGVRWDRLPFWQEKYNQLQTLVPGEQSVVFPNAPEGIVFPGDPGVRRTLAPTKETNFAPRLGLVWMIPGWVGGGGKTSLRASWGQFNTPIEGLSPAIMSANPPYGYTYTSAVPTLLDTPWTAAADGSSLEANGQPRFPLPAVAYGASRAHPVGSVNWAEFEPFTGIPAVAPGNTTPYAEDTLLGVERELGHGTVLDVSYVGTQAHHLLALMEANPGDAGLCLGLSEVSEVAAGSATCGPFGESGSYTRANGAVVQGTRTRFSPAFGSVTWQKTIANSHDNALEVTLKHEGSALGYSLAHTWSQSLDQGSSLADPVNPVDPSLSRGLSAFDLTHNIVANYHYRLPRLRGVRGVPEWAANGWMVSGLTRVTTGFPVTLVNNNDTSLLGTQPNGVNTVGADQMNFAGGRLELQGRPGMQPAFDTGAFGLPALGTFGDARRRFFHGPGSDDTDVALEKATALGDGKTLELRAEAFNVFNHSQFFGSSAVEGNIGSATFGQIVSAAPPRLMQMSARFRW